MRPFFYAYFMLYYYRRNRHGKEARAWKWIFCCPHRCAAFLKHAAAAGAFLPLRWAAACRDSLMGRAPHDWDVCTSARPGEIKAAFPGKCLSAPGIRHGTVTVLLEHTPYEVTTFRTDGAYSDHRRPDSVRFVRSVTDDLARRDFTVNAMAYSPAAGLIDPFGGAADLAAKRLRCVGRTGAPLLRGRAARAAHGALCGHHGLFCGAADGRCRTGEMRRTDGGRHRTQQGGILQNALRPSCGACAAQLPRAVRAAAAPVCLMCRTRRGKMR